MSGFTESAIHTLSRFILLASLFCVFSGRSQEVYGESQKVLIAASPYPPLQIDTGDISSESSRGIAIEIIIAAFEAAGMDAHVKLYPLKRRDMLFYDQAVDAHAPGKISIGEEAAETIVFHYVTLSLTYYTPNLPAETNDLLSKAGDLSMLTHLPIATLLNSAIAKTMEEYNYKLTYLENPEYILKFVKKGRAAAGTLIDITSLLALREHFSAEEIAQFKLSKEMLSMPGGIAFHKDHPRFSELKGKFTQGLQTIKDNGTYLEILESYYGKHNVPKSALTEDMREFGVDTIDFEEFMNYNRDEYGKIID